MGTRRCRACDAPSCRKGTLVIVGGETDGRWLGGFGRTIRALLWSPFVSQTLPTCSCSENHEDLIALTQLIEAGKVTPAIDRTYPLSEAPKAIRYVEDGHARGQVAIVEPRLA